MTHDQSRRFAGVAPDAVEGVGAVRLAALSRDGYRCRECGMPGDLEVHHVEPLERGGAALELGNLETFCRDCHLAQHADVERLEWSRWLARLAGE